LAAIAYNHLQLLPGVSNAKPLGEGLRIDGRRLGGLEEAAQLDAVLFQPPPVGLLREILPLISLSTTIRPLVYPPGTCGPAEDGLSVNPLGRNSITPVSLANTTSPSVVTT
jgi:hypothetical protein